MGKLFRSLLLAVFGAGLLASFFSSLFQPFMDALFRHYHIDSAKWVPPVLAFVGSEWSRLGLWAIGGATAGAWGHWLASKWDRRGDEPVKTEAVRKDATIKDELLSILSELAAIADNPPRYLSPDDLYQMKGLRSEAERLFVQLADEPDLVHLCREYMQHIFIVSDMRKGHEDYREAESHMYELQPKIARALKS